MTQSRERERIVPGERPQAARSAFLVCGFEEDACVARGAGASGVARARPWLRFADTAKQMRQRDKRKREDAERDGSPRRFQNPGPVHETLSADMHSAEAEDDVPPGSRPPEAHHRTEAREEQHLIELMAEVRAIRSRDNLVVGHLAVSVNCHIDHKTMG